MLAPAGGGSVERREETMRSFRRVLAVAAAVAMITILAGSTALGSERKTFIGVKDCVNFPPVCVFTEANLKVLRGASAYYTAIQDFGDHIYSPITIKATDRKHSTATGQCTFYYAGPKGGTGHCEYWSGTAKLAGFHAMFQIQATTGSLFSVKGPYWFDRQDDDSDQD